MKLQETVLTNDVLVMGSDNVIGKTYSELKALLQITDTTYTGGTNITIDTNNAINLDSTITGNHTFSNKLTVDGGSRINVQNSVDGGSTHGIAMWDSNNLGWAIYMSQPGANKSFGNGTAVAGYDFSQHAIRFRVADNAAYGFIFENSNEELCMSINGGNKNVYMGNNLTVANNLSAIGNIQKSGVNIISGTSTNPYINARVFQNISTTNQDGMFINYDSTGGTAASIKFYANGTTERMRINADSVGGVGIGKTAVNDRKLDVDGFISSESGYKLNGINVLYNIGLEEGTGPYLNARVIANNSTLSDDGLHINYGSTGTTNADIRLYSGNVVKARLDATDGTFQVVEPLLINPPNGIAGAYATNKTFVPTPNIKMGSAYMFPLSGTSQTFERLMSYTKIGNMISINGYFVMNVIALSGQAYMNLADLGLPLGVDSAVYPMTSQSTYFNTSISTDTSNNRLVFSWYSGSSGIKYAAVKFLLGCGFRASY